MAKKNKEIDYNIVDDIQTCIADIVSNERVVDIREHKTIKDLLEKYKTCTSAELNTAINRLKDRFFVYFIPENNHPIVSLRKLNYYDSRCKFYEYYEENDIEDTINAFTQDYDNPVMISPELTNAMYRASRMNRRMAVVVYEDSGEVEMIDFNHYGEIWYLGSRIA